MGIASYPAIRKNLLSCYTKKKGDLPMTIEDYLAFYYTPTKHTHTIRAYNDTINEELEHPHTSTIILQLRDKESPQLYDDVINDILENTTNPTFYT